ncbi:MAG: twin-arginine translocase subunit TatC [Chloroflexi bacterium]|nr:twin-arginine translocase subunit TatC [Chloroflexota bacterium]MCI0853762.1 twin-arginine translocase subunit TatC [Chloroflexota bacterium]
MMRRLTGKLWTLVTAPVRGLLWPYRAYRKFLDQEPQDNPTTDVIARAFAEPMLLVDHLEALRRHLFRALIVVIGTTALSFAFASRILDLLARPVGGVEALQSIEVTESIGTFMRVSLLTGFVLAFPYILFELFAFVNPGLKRAERRLVLFSIPFSFLLFAAGIGFTYFVVLPTALPFLLTFMGVTTVPRPSNYVRFVTSLMFWIGVSFQFPLVIYVLAGLGFVNARSLARNWRFAIVGIAVLAAAATPTVDPVNMALVMAPMIVLYLISIVLAALAGAGRRRRAAQDAQPADSAP